MTTVTGRCSWFGGPHDPSDSGSTASGIPESVPGIALLGHDDTLGHIYSCQFPNGRVLELVHSDKGPAIWTGKKIDVLYSALPLAGYTEANFPTGAIMTVTDTGKQYSTATDNKSHSGIPLIGGAIDAINNATGYQQAKGVVDTAAGGVKSIGDVLGFIGSGTGMTRILKVAGGGIIVLLAINELIKAGNGGTSPAPKVVPI